MYKMIYDLCIVKADTRNVRQFSGIKDDFLDEVKNRNGIGGILYVL